MDDAVEILYDIGRGSIESSGLLVLPGLAGRGWSGPIVINCEQGYPVMLPNGNVMD